MTSPQSICLRLTFDFAVVRSFAVMILYKSTQTWPVSSRCQMACFYDMAGKTIHFTHSQIKPYFESHWPYLNYLCVRILKVSLNQAWNGNVNTLFLSIRGNIRISCKAFVYDKRTSVSKCLVTLASSLV